MRRHDAPGPWWEADQPVMSLPQSTLRPWRPSSSAGVRHRLAGPFACFSQPLRTSRVHSASAARQALDRYERTRSSPKNAGAADGALLSAPGARCSTLPAYWPAFCGDPTRYYAPCTLMSSVARARCPGSAEPFRRSSPRKLGYPGTWAWAALPAQHRPAPRAAPTVLVVQITRLRRATAHPGASYSSAS